MPLPPMGTPPARRRKQRQKRTAARRVDDADTTTASDCNAASPIPQVEISTEAMVIGQTTPTPVAVSTPIRGATQSTSPATDICVRPDSAVVELVTAGELDGRWGATFTAVLLPFFRSAVRSAMANDICDWRVCVMSDKVGVRWSCFGSLLFAFLFIC